MNNNVVIKTTKLIYPQIYAYTLPDMEGYEGWVKIGYTERKDVEERIREQTHTPAVRLKYSKLWSAPAKFLSSDKWFKDHQFHAYLRSQNREQYPNSEWFYYNGYLEQSLSDFQSFSKLDETQSHQQKLAYQLRPEQAAAVKQTLDYAKKYESGEFLWNAKPRFGKTLTTYDFARQLGAKMVLIVTNRPAIANSWFDDYEKFIGWQTDYAFVSESESLKDRPVMSREEFLEQQATGKRDLITFISLQDLKGAISFGGKYDKLSWVKDLSWDLLVIDEAHEGVDTFKTGIAFDNITRKFTLYLSGTPFKAVASGKFMQEEIYNWTYADEQAAKANWDDSEQNNPYANLPQLNLFSYQMSRMITDEINQGADIEGENIDFAFDLNEFFATKENGRFTHEAEVKKWLDTLSYNKKYPFSTKELQQELKHTFWLLDRVASARALQRMLKNHPVFEEYEIILAAGDGRTEEEKQIISAAALDRVRNAIAKHEKTITLSVGQLTTGVTIPEWTGVLMLSNIQSPSLYMQAAFRAQNPWKYTINGEDYRKERAYVFDFAPERTLIIYDEFANNLSISTADGAGTTEDRRENIKELINFFPVIAEDSAGEMIELNVDQVLTIPKYIKAREVVKRGFMSNLLFQNISGIFASTEVREILEQLNPVEVGKVTPRKGADKIDTQNVEVDEEGKVIVDHSLVIAESDARFGEKVYKNIQESTEKLIQEDQGKKLATEIKAAFIEQIKEPLKELAKENDLTVSVANREIEAAGAAIAREVEFIQKQNDIQQREAEAEYKRIIQEAKHDEVRINEAKEKCLERKAELTQEHNEKVSAKIQETVTELTQNSTREILEKGEEKKKNSVEDDVRARLRGFARTIPSFLMAYGKRDTTLGNFDHHIKDEVFKEVTGITLDQFRTLRDTYSFFDETVFNQSVTEFLNKREELANYFVAEQEEDIFDYIPPQQTNQIFTPRKVVNLMLDKLEEENPGIFSDSTKTFADLYMKSGLYITEIVKRLYKGLEEEIPDEDTRLKHIVENQVYGFAPTEIIYNIARNYILGFDERSANINAAHIIHLDTLPYAKGELDFEEKCKKLFGVSEMKFDVVVGNPPYQEENESGGNNRNSPIYHYFYDLAEKVGSKYCLISPARFLFNAGQTPKKWNEKMLHDPHIQVVLYESDSSKLFSGADIRGGITIIYRDEEVEFGEIGTFSQFPELTSIMGKVLKKMGESFSNLILPQGVYRFHPCFFEKYPKAKAMQGKGTGNKIVSKSLSQMDFVFTPKQSSKNDISMIGLVGKKREIRWIHCDYIDPPESFEQWKVLIAESNGSGELGEALSAPFIAEPFTGHTDTFLTIGGFKLLEEAENVLKYIKTKFSRIMLGTLKITQHNSRSTWLNVPLQDFTSNSDIDWSKSISEIDQQLYKKYGLTQEEIDFIEEKVKPMT